MFNLHRDEVQWIKPDEFIPERFDNSSPYFLTPSGTKRHPMSFGPFLGGKRICIGKTFAETSSKFIVAMFLNRFPNLEFIDRSNYAKLTRINAMLVKDPVIMVKTKLTDNSQ
jgi:cytochrome P450